MLKTKLDPETKEPYGTMDDHEHDSGLAHRYHEALWRIAHLSPEERSEAVIIACLALHLA